MNQKKKQPSRKPINVQLTKDDLKELLTVLKDFMVEEISGHSRVQTHRMACHNSRITKLERIEQYREPKRVLLCPHEENFKGVWYSGISNRPLGLTYRCKRCGQERIKTTIMLSWGEKRAIRKLGVKLL